METTTPHTTPRPIPLLRNKYGITEKKKAELDELTLQVTDAQYEVNECQSIVISLTSKVTNFQGYLALADADRTETLNNKNLAKQLVQSALELRGDSKVAFGEMESAKAKTQLLSGGIKQVIDELIYTAEMLNKLAAIVTRKKALNPLISDELVSLIATAGADANNAVALTLVALKSTFVAEASNIESTGAIGLAYTLASRLCETLTEEIKNVTPLKTLFDDAYTKAKDTYKRMEDALAIAVAQLSEATSNLNTAQVKLKSLQSGLAAANAAALA
jgi:chromosome segregation ATPase